MRKAVLASVILLAASLVANAQEKAPTPVAEVGFNYSFDHWNPSGTVPSFTENGGSGTVVYNVNSLFGVAGDLGVYHAGTIGNSTPLALNNTTFTYLFGPRLTWRTHSRFTPYVQGLVGGARLSNAFDAGSPTPLLGTSGNDLAWEFGGGVDMRITDHIAFKPVEVDYLMVRQNEPSVLQTSIANNLRYSAGVVFRFGSK
jgi:opacity protein-like surface antigen